MISFVVRRLLQSIVVVVAVSVIIFILPRIAGNPANALLPPNATQEDIDRLSALWGLDRPWPVQYLNFMANALTGEFGESSAYHQPAINLIGDRLPTTLSLTLLAFVILVPVGIGGGVIAAIRPRGLIAHVLRAFAVALQAMPSFWLGLMLIIVVAVQLRWLPTSGNASMAGYVLPAVTLAAFPAGALIRITRVSVLEVLSSGYVELARAKGLSESRVISVYALRTALVSPLTFLGFSFAALMTGSVIIETVFALPGVGLLGVQSIRSGDYAVIQPLILILAFVYILANVLVDILYAALDPRIRVSA